MRPFLLNRFHLSTRFFQFKTKQILLHVVLLIISPLASARNLEEPPTDITYHAEGQVPIFTLESELRILKLPLDQKPLTSAGLNKNEIALTFDDGPDPEWTPVVLRTLKEHGVKATFFIMGKQAAAHPGLVKQILQEGHSIGNHTWDHAQLTKLTIEQARKEIQKTKDVLAKISSEVGLPIQPFFRFPFGDGALNPDLQSLIGEFNYANFFWRMSAHDSRTKDANVTLTWSVEMIEAYKKGIFLNHDVRPHTAKMLPYFLHELYLRGFKTIYFQAENTLDNNSLNVSQ
jgi:peptidoglycan/xylan/chitin deacetylase (PgdA/CDA1 family)